MHYHHLQAKKAKTFEQVLLSRHPFKLTSWTILCKIASILTKNWEYNTLTLLQLFGKGRSYNLWKIAHSLDCSRYPVKMTKNSLAYQEHWSNKLFNCFSRYIQTITLLIKKYVIGLKLKRISIKGFVNAIIISTYHMGHFFRLSQVSLSCNLLLVNDILMHKSIHHCHKQDSALAYRCNKGKYILPWCLLLQSTSHNWSILTFCKGLEMKEDH